MMRKIHTLAGAGIVAMAMLGLGGTASAAETASPGAAADCFGFWDDPRGSGCFQSYGDKIGVEDLKKDGIGVQVYWETDYGRTGICRDKNSSGGMGYCNYNMKEGQEVRIWLQFTDNGSVIGSIGPSQYLTI